MNQARIRGFERRVAVLQGGAAVTGSLHRVENAETSRDLRQAQEGRQQVERERDTVLSQLEEAQANNVPPKHSSLKPWEN